MHSDPIAQCYATLDSGGRLGGGKAEANPWSGCIEFSPDTPSGRLAPMADMHPALHPSRLGWQVPGALNCYLRENPGHCDPNDLLAQILA